MKNEKEKLQKLDEMLREAKKKGLMTEDVQKFIGYLTTCDMEEVDEDVNHIELDDVPMYSRNDIRTLAGATMYLMSKLESSDEFNTLVENIGVFLFTMFDDEACKTHSPLMKNGNFFFDERTHQLRMEVPTSIDKAITLQAQEAYPETKEMVVAADEMACTRVVVDDEGEEEE